MAIPDDRGDESFADDLNMWPGIVSGRVALSLRSTEIQPAAAPICPLLHSIVGFVGVPLPFVGERCKSPPHPGGARGTPSHAHVRLLEFDGHAPPTQPLARVAGCGVMRTSRCVALPWVKKDASRGGATRRGTALHAHVPLEFGGHAPPTRPLARLAVGFSKCPDAWPFLGERRMQVGVGFDVPLYIPSFA